MADTRKAKALPDGGIKDCHQVSEEVRIELAYPLKKLEVTQRGYEALMKAGAQGSVDALGEEIEVGKKASFVNTDPRMRMWRIYKWNEKLRKRPDGSWFAGYEIIKDMPSLMTYNDPDQAVKAALAEAEKLA